MRMSVFSKPVSVVVQVIVTMLALSYKWCKIVGVVKFEVFAVVLMKIPFLILDFRRVLNIVNFL